MLSLNRFFVFTSSISLGIILVLILGLISWFLAYQIPLLGSVSIAIILGMVAGNVIRDKTKFNPGISFAEKRLLPLAIAFLGTTLKLDVLFSLGIPALLLVVSLVVVTIVSSGLLGRKLGFSRSFSLLMGTGNAICGSSAIAAVSHSLNATEKETGISVGIVNFMGVIGLFILPVVLMPMNISPDDKAMVIGGSLQAVGQVVAAGYSLGPEIGAAAVLIKMGRVLLLGPLTLFFAFRQKGRKEDETKTSFKFPYFILGFFVLSFLSSFNYLPLQVIEGIKICGKFLLVISMAAIGFKIQFSALKTHGSKALLFGFLIMLIQISYICAWLWLF